MKDILYRIFFEWITNIKAISIIFAFLLFWVAIWYGNTALHANCDVSVNNLPSFITEGCIEEGSRNNFIIKKMFPIMLGIGIGISFLISFIDLVKKRM